MKRIFSLILAAALIVSAFPLAAMAEKEIPTALEYDGDIFCEWDNIFQNLDADENVICEFGKAKEWYVETAGEVVGPYEALYCNGWVAADQAVVGFGYAIDDGEPVFDDGFFRNAEDKVLEVSMLPQAARYMIRVPLTDVKTQVRIRLLVKMEDGNVWVIGKGGWTIDLTYMAEKNTNPDATEAPEVSEDDLSFLPELFLVFDEEDKYGIYGGNGNGVEETYFDEEKKCEVMVVPEGPDPYQPMTLGGFDEEVDCSIYKVVQLGVRINYASDKNGQFFFSTDEYPGIVEGQNTSFSYKNTEDIQAVTINFSKTKKWSGILTDFRYDMYGNAGVDSNVELYYIAFFKTKDDAQKFANLYAQKGNAAFPVVEEPTAKPTAAPTQAPTDPPAITDEPTVTDVPDVTEAPTGEVSADKKGCGNAIVSGMAVLALLSAAVVIRKKHD